MDPILALIIVYSAASLLHHAHNAEFLAIYPGLPGWLSPAHIYAAWILATVLAAVGYVLLRRQWARTGTCLIVASAAWGFASLSHYVLAPFAQHTTAMHLTIGLEVATAVLLVIIVLRGTLLAMVRTCP